MSLELRAPAMCVLQGSTLKCVVEARCVLPAAIQHIANRKGSFLEVLSESLHLNFRLQVCAILRRAMRFVQPSWQMSEEHFDHS